MKIFKAFICLIVTIKCQTEENGSDEVLEAPPIPLTTGMILRIGHILGHILRPIKMGD